MLPGSGIGWKGVKRREGHDASICWKADCTNGIYTLREIFKTVTGAEAGIGKTRIRQRFKSKEGSELDLKSRS